MRILFENIHFAIYFIRNCLIFLFAFNLLERSVKGSNKSHQDGSSSTAFLQVILSFQAIHKSISMVIKMNMLTKQLTMCFTASDNFV